MGRAVYLNMKDARDIRNLDELFADHDPRVFADESIQKDLWVFFRALRVRLDKAGNKTKAWAQVRKRKL